MHKCTLCGKKYPLATLTHMVQIESKKAYMHMVCPACRVTAANNPHYYPVVEDKNPQEK